MLKISTLNVQEDSTYTIVDFGNKGRMRISTKVNYTGVVGARFGSFFYYSDSNFPDNPVAKKSPLIYIKVYPEFFIFTAIIMEDTIGNRLNDPFAGQTFRITYKAQDFEIKVLKKVINKDQSCIDILLDGIVQRLIKLDGKWCFDGTNSDQSFANDIWRAISLRYRL